MPRQENELDPVSYITVDAIGKPGERVFFIQGAAADHTLTVLIEKVQIQSLAVGVEQFLTEISQRFPELPEASGDFVEEHMHLHPPLDPVFRVGEIGLAYDSDRDLICLIAREILTGEMTPEDASVVRFWCTRAQLRAMCRWGLEVAGRGRPVCPQCGEPMDPEGHFCPKKNGHKH
jgi:uncharacterized repeat protein (TIGR03847 family)